MRNVIDQRGHIPLFEPVLGEVPLQGDTLMKRSVHQTTSPTIFSAWLTRISPERSFGRRASRRMARFRDSRTFALILSTMGSTTSVKARAVSSGGTASSYLAMSFQFVRGILVP